MRTSPIAFALVVLAGEPVALQDAPRTLNSLNAKDHVGEVATVCGHVVSTFCDMRRGSTTLTFVPIEAPVRIRIANTDRTLFGPRVEDAYSDRIVCATGRIEARDLAYEIDARDPSVLRIQPDARLPTPVVFAPHAHRLCDLPGVVMPKVTREVRPQYTSAAMANKVEGKVLLEGVVETDGNVGAMRIIRALDRELDQQAAAAFKRWKFAPATHMGQPVAVIVITEMTFTIRR